MAVAAVDKAGAPAPRPRAQAPKVEPKAKMAPDRVEIRSTKPVQLESAAKMRQGLFEMIGGVAAFSVGAVGFALTLSAPVWIPAAFAILTLGGMALTLKGIDDYAKGIAQLIVDILLLPVHIARALKGPPPEES